MIHPAYTACIGIIEANEVALLGTGFFVTKDKVVTARHVIAGRSGRIVIIPSYMNTYDGYQDTTNRQVSPYLASVIEEDPVKDLCILQSNGGINVPLLSINGLDDCNVGDDIEIYGYPHCTDGRRVLTYQKSQIGAKVLLDSSGINTKFAIINTQARPGQSGSPVISKSSNTVLGVLIGAYSNLSGGYVTMGNINPAELHQTTQCISAEYIKDML